VTRVSATPPPPHDDDPRFYAEGGDGDGGRTNAWMLATIAIVALLVGIGAGLLIESGGGDTSTETVRIRSTVAGTNPEAVTVTQPPRETTVVRTQTATVTVTVPTTPTATQP
jgi:hypothetical protein